MKITAIKAWQVDLPLAEGDYKWSEGKSVKVFDSTVVRVETSTGLAGHGECCPLGPAYLPAYARGVRAGLAELAPQLLGADPTQLGALNRRMDYLLKGHPYVKSAIDIACWDILGQVAGLPVCHLLGGRFGDDMPLYRAISQRPPREMAANVAEYGALTMPSGRLGVVTVSVAGVTVIDSGFAALCEAASVTRTVNVELPAAVGVPLIAPAGVSVSPAGRFPELTLHA